MGVTIVLLIFDQIVKAWARHVFADNLAAFHSLPWPGVFEFTLTYNKGIAFGFLQGHGALLAPIAIVMAGGATYYSLRHPEESRLNHVAMALLTAGALGNLIDRLVFGQVTDMFFARFINFPVFNVADACITVSAALLIYGWTTELVSGHSPQPATVNRDP